MLYALPTMLKSDKIAVLILAGVVVVLQIVLTILLLKTFVFKPHWTQPRVILGEREKDETPAEEGPTGTEYADYGEEPFREAPDEPAVAEPDESSSARQAFAMEPEEEPADGWYGNGEFIEPTPKPIFLFTEDEADDGIPRGEVPSDGEEPL